MFFSLLLLLFSYILATGYQSKSVYIENGRNRNCGWQPLIPDAKTLYFFLSVLLILYSGLRSRNNDTASYISGFQYTRGGFSGLLKIDLFGGEEVGFQIYLILIKTIFGNNYARYLVITAWITFGSYISFFRKYSSDFSLTVFLLIASTFYSYTTAAMRQCLAMAIGIWCVPCFFEKRYLKGILWALLAASFHKFTIFYLVAIVMIDDVWKTKSLLIVFGTIVISVTFTSFFTEVAEITGYDSEHIVGSAGTTIFRTLVWLVPVVLSFLYKDQINFNCDDMTKCFINLSLVGSMIMVLASFGGANLIGRTAYYFYPFFIMSFGEILHPKIMGENAKSLRTICIWGFVAYYFILEFTGFSRFFYDSLRHNSIFVLLKSYLA